jgi:hypothetical protein
MLPSEHISVHSTQDDTSAILNNSEWAVVTLVVYDSAKKEIARGKAVLVSPDGYVLTNYHLVCQGVSAKVEIPKRTKTIKKVEWENVFSPSVDMERDSAEKKKKPKGKRVDVEGIAAVDKAMNFALLKIKGRGHPSAPIATSDQFNIGDKSLVVIDAESISEGSITNVGELSGTKKVAQISITFPEDMSGLILRAKSRALPSVSEKFRIWSCPHLTPSPLPKIKKRHLFQSMPMRIILPHPKASTSKAWLTFLWKTMQTLSGLSRNQSDCNQTILKHSANWVMSTAKRTSMKRPWRHTRNL